MVRAQQLVAAVESLYADQICPHSRILKRRLVELNKDGTLRTVDIDTDALRAALVATPGLSTEPDPLGDWTAVQCSRKPNFIDVHDPEDTYAPSLWESFHRYIASLADRQSPTEYRLPSSRYACAHELQSRALPFFAGLTLGSLCHIVQLAVSQKSILGYRDGALVPYAMSRCLLKKQHAEHMLPCAPAHAEGVLPCADWDTVRSCMVEIMDEAKHNHEGVERLANVKRIFRAKYHLELSETMLGHTKLSELLQDPQLGDICSVELRNGGYAVVPSSSPCCGEPFQMDGCGSHAINIASPSPPQIAEDMFGDFVACSSALAPPQIADDTFAACQSQYGVIGVQDLGSFSGLGLQLQFASEVLAPPQPMVTKGGSASLKVPQAPWQLSPSTLSKEGSITRVPGLGAVKNTFIEVPITPVTPAMGAQKRSRSLPKNMGSNKNEWELACHVLSYQHCPVESREQSGLGRAVRTITVDKHGGELGLDVSRDGEALLVEGVSPGAVEWWNACHPEEPVMPGDRILEVNGVAGNALLMVQACKTAETLTLTVRRCAQMLSRKRSEPSFPSPTSSSTARVVQTPSFDTMPVCAYAPPCCERQGLQLFLAGCL